MLQIHLEVKRLVTKGLEVHTRPLVSLWQFLKEPPGTGTSLCQTLSKTRRHTTAPHGCARPRNPEFLPATVKDVCQWIRVPVANVDPNLLRSHPPSTRWLDDSCYFQGPQLPLSSPTLAAPLRAYYHLQGILSHRGGGVVWPVDPIAHSGPLRGKELLLKGCLPNSTSVFQAPETSAV